MSFFTKWLFLSLFSLFSLSFLQAQNSRIVFSTGGSFNSADNLVSLYSMEPGTQPVVELARKGDFSNVVHVDGNDVFFHVGRAASHPDGADLIFRYDLLSQQVLDSVEAAGTQRVAAASDYLVVTRGFGADSAFVLIYDKSNLAQGPVYQDEVVNEFCREVLITGDDAWVSYDSAGIGMLAQFSLEPASMGFEQRYVLDSLAAGMSTLFMYKDSLLALAEIVDFPPPNFNPVVRHASLVMLDPMTGGFQLDTSLSHANSPVDVMGDIFYANFGGGLQGLNLINGQFSDTLFSKDYTAAAFNNNTSTFSIQETDYFSFGSLTELDPANTASNQTFSTDISGSAIDVAYNIVSSIIGEAGLNVSVFPNPASNWLSIDFGEKAHSATVEIMSLEGKVLFVEQLRETRSVRIAVSSLPAGMYIAHLRADGREAVVRFVKR